MIQLIKGETGYTLILGKEEKQFIFDLTEQIGGLPDKSPRGFIDTLRRKLRPFVNLTSGKDYSGFIDFNSVYADTPTINVNVSIDEDDAIVTMDNSYLIKTLHVISRKIGGDMFKSRRKYADSLQKAIHQHFPAYQSYGMMATGSVYFTGGDELYQPPVPDKLEFKNPWQSSYSTQFLQSMKANKFGQKYAYVPMPIEVSYPPWKSTDRGHGWRPLTVTTKKFRINPDTQMTFNYVEVEKKILAQKIQDIVKKESEEWIWKY